MINLACAKNSIFIYRPLLDDGIICIFTVGKPVTAQEAVRIVVNVFLTNKLRVHFNSYSLKVQFLNL